MKLANEQEEGKMKIRFDDIEELEDKMKEEALEQKSKKIKKMKPEGMQRDAKRNKVSKHINIEKGFVEDKERDDR